MYRRICKECGIVFDTEDGYRRLCDYCAGERKKRQAWHGDVQRRRVRKPEAEKPKEPWVVNKKDCGGCKYFFEHGTESTCDYFLVTGKIKQPLGAPTKDCKYREKGPKAQIPGTYEQYSEALKRKRAERAAKAEAPEKAETPQETKPKGRPKGPEMSAEERKQILRERAQRQYEKHKAEHRCTKCGVQLPPERKATICEKCAKKRRDYEMGVGRENREEIIAKRRASSVEAQKRCKEKRMAMGLCIRCGIQLPEGWKKQLCEKCSEAKSQYMKARRCTEKCRN